MNAGGTAPTAGKSRLKVLLTGLGENPTLSAGRELARQHGPSGFEITQSCEEAEIVLYLEQGYIGIADLPRVFRHVDAAPFALHFIFSESDWPYPILPGLYPSLNRPCPWAQTWCYLPKLRTASNALASSLAPKFLFSFLGRSRTHRVRQKILLLNSNESPCVDVDLAQKQVSDLDYANSYWTLLFNSKFILCPRGFGASSIRIFEVMSAGRVPVIISDSWQQTPGIPWHDFCVFVAERHVQNIPKILQQSEADWQRKAQLAKIIYERFFAPEVFFEQLLQTLMANYFACSSRRGKTLSRAWRSLGWREIKTVLSQAKLSPWNRKTN